MSIFKSKFLRFMGAPKIKTTTKPVKPGDAAVKDDQGNLEKGQQGLASFLRLPSGVLLIVRMILLILAAVCFNMTGENQRAYTVLIIMEIFIVLFFIIIYMLTVNLVLFGLDWSLLEALNLLASAIFLIIVGIVSLKEKKKAGSFYLGGVIAMIVALLCLLNIVLVYWKKFVKPKEEADKTTQETAEKKENKAPKIPVASATAGAK